MPIKTLEQLENEKAALEKRLDWLHNNPHTGHAILDTRVKLNNVLAMISTYKPHDYTPNPA